MSQKHEEQERNSRRWQSLRLAVFERDDYRCHKCGGVGWSNNPLTVQHARPLLELEDLFALDACVTLCRRCHRREDAARTPLR